MSIKYQDPDLDLVIKEQSTDPESVSNWPEAPADSPEAKTSWRLSDLYADIAKYRTLPTSRYTDPATMAEEWDKLWTKTWLFAGVESDVKEPGDWFRFDIARESLIVARTETGAIKAFYNACKHRGTRLVETDFGRGASGFACPFHGWKFGLDGRNVRVTDRDTFEDSALCGSIDIETVRCESFGGLIFVNLNTAGDAATKSLKEFLGSDMINMLLPYQTDKMFVAKDASYVMPANWKTTSDAFQEIYHTQATHPQFKDVVDDYFVQFDHYENGHNRMLVPFMKVSHRMSDRESLNPMFEFSLEEAGVDPSTVKGGPEEARKAVQQAKRSLDNKYGLDYSGFTDNQLTDDWNISVFPHITFNAHPEGFLIQRFRPHETDIDKCYYDVIIVIRKMREGCLPPAYMGIGPEADLSGKVRPARLYLTDDTVHEIGEALMQDVSNLGRVQAGLYSRGMEGKVRFSEHERRIQQFYAEMDLYLEANKSV